MPGIRRKPVSTDGLLGVVPGAVRRKPVAASGQYQQAPQEEHEHQDELHGGTRTGLASDGAEWNSLLPDSNESDLADMRTSSVSPLTPTRDDIYHSPSSVHDVSPVNDNDPLPLGHQVSTSSTEAKDEIVTSYSPYHLDSPWPAGTRRRMWTPFWLSKLVLIAFAITFFLMLLATALLYHFSQANNGISSESEANHYGWKYGPTALLVVVGLLWRQVDNSNKISMPWKELRNGPMSVEKTLLLDYVSPILPKSFWLAIKNKHWAVVMSIVGHQLILATTVFSTGLLILESTEVSKTSDEFRVKGNFEINKDVDPNSIWLVGPAAAQLYYGINFQGLRYPAGTSEDTVVPELEMPPASSTNINYTTTTKGLKIDYDCEVLPIKNATMVYMPWRSILGSFFVSDINATDCNIKGAMFAAGPDHNFYRVKNATQNYQAQFRAYPCNVDWDWSQEYIMPNDTKTYDMLTNTSTDQRLLMSVADLRFTPYNVSRTDPEQLWLNEMTALLCKPSYSLDDFQVQRDSVTDGAAQAVLSSASTSSRKQVDGFHDGSLALAVQGTVDNWYLGTGGDDYVLSEQVPTFFQLMSMKNGDSRLQAFMDPDLLLSMGSNVFKGIATQILHQLTIQPANQTVTGQITFNEDRLQVKGLSTGFMCSFLGVLVFLSIAMIFLRPHDVVPHQPGSIASTATVLTASPHLHETLKNLEASRLSQIRERLGNFKFQTILIPGQETRFSIDPVSQKEGQTFYEASESDQKVSWWRPMAGQNWFLALAIALPLLMIAGLEIVQHFSDRNRGFIQVGETSSLVLATYVPAAIALGVASMYTALKMMAAMFAPFNALQRGRATADRSIHLDLVSKLPPHAAFLSLKTRHFAVLVALLGSLIGGFLTIVVSGLYSAVDVPMIQQVTVQQQDSFMLDDIDLSLNDNQAAAIDSLIEYLDLNYTQWTHETLAFNHLEQTDVVIDNSTEQAPLNVRVPATRARLNCTTIPNQDRNITVVEADQNTDSMGILPGMTAIFEPRPGYLFVAVNTTFKHADWCDEAPSKNKTELNWVQWFFVPNDTSPAYVGKATIMEWGEENIVGDGAVDTDVTTGSGIGAEGLTIKDNGCPSFAVTMGTLRLENEETIRKKKHFNFDQDLGTTICYQNVEEVAVNTTWQLPRFDLDGTHLPETDESTAKLLKTKSGRERFPFAVNAWLIGLSDSVYNRTLPGPDGTSSLNNDIDEFIKAVVNSKHGRPLDEVVGEANVDALTRVAHALYETYMAQAISLNMRQPASTAARAAQPSFNGTLTTSGRQRLQQNRGPKTALQVMLGAMVACAIATRALVRVGRVLPHDPCSLAGTASMLAGGRMVGPGMVPVGAEWRGDGELRRAGVFEGSVYSLRWWEDGEGGRRRYGIDVDS